jgi:quinol monooxygenase YgiN
MIAVLIRVRAVSPDTLLEACRILVQTIVRSQGSGLLHGRCLLNPSDPLETLVYEEWTSHQAWEVWYNSEARLNFLRDLAPLIEGDLHITVYEEA